jgi:NADPH-dependent 2,4-dienoyl-CoA reductase/sulfur reductase-like enzyme
MRETAIRRNYSRASRAIDVVAHPDVLVCGAGCAGIGAAVAAARTGARTMVVDMHLLIMA